MLSCYVQDQTGNKDYIIIQTAKGQINIIIYSDFTSYKIKHIFATGLGKSCCLNNTDTRWPLTTVITPKNFSKNITHHFDFVLECSYSVCR